MLLTRSNRSGKIYSYYGNQRHQGENGVMERRNGGKKRHLRLMEKMVGIVIEG